MTNKEAYEILEKYIRCSNNECPPVDCDECQDHVTAKQLDDALQVALEALKEPKQPDHIAVVSKKDDENGDDLIRREDALMSLTGEWTESRDESLSKAIRRIKRLPSIQPEIIRCKDCKHWRQQTNYQGAPLSFGFCESDNMWRSLYGETTEVSHIDTDDDFYCGYAERRIDD